MKPKFDVQQPWPVIIGTGLTGLAVSRALSQKSIQHVLIGKPINATTPRLGESLNIEATLDLVEFFPDFLKYCAPKISTVYYRGNKAIYLPLDMGSYGEIVRFFNLLGFRKVPPSTVHVDRLAFDEALFTTCIASEYCNFIDEKVIDLSYDPETDCFTELTLSNGLRVKPTFIFDATNHIRLIPKKLNILYQTLSEKQNVIFTHYHRSTPLQEHQACWYEATSLVRLEKEIDDIDGIAWCIPLHDYISVGISVEADSYTLSDSEVLARVDAAFARRGLDYSDHNYRQTKVVSIRNQQYFIHDRGYGGNWLLAGGTYAQTWFINAAGVAMAFYIAHFADQFLKSPLKTGQQYEDFIKGFLMSHEASSTIILDRFTTMTIDELRNTVGTLFVATLIRLCLYSKGRGTRRVAFFATIGKYILDKKLFFLNPILDNYCRIVETDLGNQTHEIHALAEESLKRWRNPSAGKHETPYAEVVSH